MDLTPLSDASTIRSGAATLVLEDSGGGGPAVVCLHSGVTDRRSWRAFGHHLGGRVVTYDRRGFGETSYVPEPYDPVADLLAVLDLLDLDRVVLVGNSQGGRVALDTSLEHPDRVLGLVLVCSAFTGGPVWQPADYPPTLTDLDQRLDRADESGDTGEVNRLEAQLWLDGWSAPVGRVDDPVRGLFLEMNLRALTSEDPGAPPDREPVWTRLGDVVVPALVVETMLDLPWTVQRGRLAADLLADGHCEVLDEVGHLPGLERPDLLTGPVRDHLDRLG